MTVTSVLPSYVSFSGFSFTFKPGYALTPVTVPIAFYVSDEVNTMSYSFNLQVLNNPPVFTYNPVDQVI